MQLTVESLDRTKSGSGYQVKAGGDKYFCKAPGIEQTVGKVIDATTGSFAGKNGPVKTIDAFTIVEGASPGGSTAPSSNHWYMPFVSNVCAHAIQSGLIKDGKELRDWARHAQTAALALDEEIPF